MLERRQFMDISMYLAGSGISEHSDIGWSPRLKMKNRLIPICNK